MKQLFEFVDTKTRDGIRLHGLFAAPKRKASIGIIWIHGLTGAFWHSAERAHALAAEATESDYAFAILNNRGHDVVDDEKTKTGKTYFIGGGFEKFTDCIKDIDATIRFVRSRGCKKVILVGHSTGANKVAYYLARKSNRAVKGAVLLSGLSDVRRLDKKLRGLLSEAAKIAKKKPMAVLPYEKFGMFMSAQRYVSLFTPGGVEDVFPYHGQGGKWTILNKIRVPVLVAIGDQDEHLPIPLKKYLAIVKQNLKRAPQVTTAVIRGAHHSFREYEQPLARTIVRWVKSI